MLYKSHIVYETRPTENLLICFIMVRKHTKWIGTVHSLRSSRSVPLSDVNLSALPSLLNKVQFRIASRFKPEQVTPLVVEFDPHWTAM